MAGADVPGPSRPGENPLLGFRDAAGPELWANWRASLAGAPSAGASEYAIYSDAHVTGELLDALGPYRIFNGLGSVAGLGVAVVLRAEQHLWDAKPRDIDWSRGGTEHWVGHAPVSDHVASLLSLCLNARFRSGGTIRDFDGDDPRGRPTFIQHRPVVLPAPEHGPLIPGLAGPVSLDGDVAARLATVPALSAADATALLRAARQYRQALWSSESDPELSWLLLVGAAETGAVAHAGTAGEPAARLEEAMPELADVLTGAGGQDLLDAAGPHLADLVRSTARFRAFLAEHDPGPPTERPADPSLQVAWEALPKALGTVYKHRSKALHSGVPFPPPMWEPPRAYGPDGVPSERPPGHATHWGGSTWLAKDAPMHLHVFAHVVRGALLRWWAAAATAGT